MINFNLFVLPFSLGLLYLFFAVGKSWYKWIRALPAHDRMKFRVGLKHPELWFSAVKEVIMEGILHRKMWQQNPLLGYMHTSFALGWLLLIIFGNLESRYYSGTHLNAPYYPIFLKFFIHDKLVIFFEVEKVPGFFRFIMDLLLIYVLSGLLLAWIKRKKSKWFGMRRTSEYQLTDKIALTSLWLIFPMRLMAESLTAGYYGSGGGFFTQPLGNFLAWLIPLPDDYVAYTFWWGYSLVLGIFFVTLPYSRYMHIPTEILLIFFRKLAIQPREWYASVSEVEVHACSRCGVCLDVCQMNEAGIFDAQAVYFIEGVRNQYVPDEIGRKCLVCGRCQEVCPVGIRIDSLRLIKRREMFAGQISDFSFLQNKNRSLVSNHLPGNDGVVYFSGCMSQLTPAIVQSMIAIFRKAGISFIHLDEKQSICCGRPLKLAGKSRQALELIEANRRLILQTHAKMLVTSCPICFRVFKEEYNLPIRIVHHTQFLSDLIKSGAIPLQSAFPRVVYHDPCDLGRGAGVYSPPRDVLSKIADILPLDHEKDKALCCGGSLGMFNASTAQRAEITRNAFEALIKPNPDMIVTACPLCKKTFSGQSAIPVKDIAEMIHEAVPA
jgi:Fe-S oxidoreductase